MTILLQEKPGPARPDVHGLPATFGSLGVPAPLVAPLDAAGITVPVPIQAAALSDALAERDILGKAAPAPVRRSAIHSRSSRGAAGRVVADTTRQLWEELAALSAPVRRRALDRLLDVLPGVAVVGPGAMAQGPGAARERPVARQVPGPCG